jgi:hypothetical protein
MKYLNNLPAFYLIFALFTFVSCDKDLPTDGVEFKKRLVVYAFADNDNVIQVKVAKSLAINDTVGADPIENAIVKILDQSTSKEEILSYSFLNGGSYNTNYKPKLGNKYSLSVELNDFPMVYGQFEIPRSFVAGKAIWKDSTNKDSLGFYTGTISFNINDPGNELNFYEIGIFRYQALLNEWILMPVLPENPEIAENPVTNSDGALILQDVEFNGQTKLLKFSTPYGYSSGFPYKFLVVVKSLSPDYFKYMKSVGDYQTQGGPFSDPSPIFTNMQGGIGICAGASITKDTIR